eukprot:441160-Prymnesium_polylepis.3
MERLKLGMSRLDGGARHAQRNLERDEPNEHWDQRREHLDLPNEPCAALAGGVLELGVSTGAGAT